MKKLIIIGNWKSYKGISDANAWFDAFSRLFSEKNHQWTDITVVLCPPYTLLPLSQQRIEKDHLPLALGGQDVSAFDEGAHTGEINTHQLAEFATWTIIGHSERRRDLGETDVLLFQKVEKAKKQGLRVVYCLQNEVVEAPKGVDVIAYEPPWAISSVSGGVPQNPESANRVCEKIVQKYPGIPVIYGGSVTLDNVASFVSQEHIWGVLPGNASLDADKFYSLIDHATQSQTHLLT
ncbi:MAG: hypothetical protein ACD_36C00044G0002 [uncultured bacterium]|uniref:Triosephosphate isomerase n=1 Tax=Candidatus Gottesmanbacteria bacterium RIFCSPLOWO2_01_FULL_43_11b TaxID=1798392 RepID=A0A1F6AHK0_9BACT|nr:MAG: hypothetical protein ACD_36C00044G0002 [uncultured bacterium]OGG24194.1 MAG: hypothetical protein A3A79_03330 [Candidatus Gottesmanbacteria bacterium RIFCSPLOWO2_01_FULL_43_11b]